MKEHLDADLNSVHKRLVAQWNSMQDVKVSRGRSSVGERIAGSDDVAGSNPAVSTLEQSRMFDSVCLIPTS